MDRFEGAYQIIIQQKQNISLTSPFLWESNKSKYPDNQAYKNRQIMSNRGA